MNGDGPAQGVRLQRFLAQAGIASRRRAEELIAGGRVGVNGHTATQLGTKVDPARDRVTVDGKVVRPQPFRYLALNKPPGYVVTLRDPQGRPTVADLLGRQPVRVYPVGRLDAETSGLLLLMNDGVLAHRIAHPRFGVEKTYRARVAGRLGLRVLEALCGELVLSDGPVRAVRIEVVEREEGGGGLEIAVREGRNHLVRRMLAAVGLEVVQLARIAEGSIRLGNLAEGEWRELSRGEVGALRREVGLAGGGPRRTGEYGPLPLDKRRPNG